MNRELNRYKDGISKEYTKIKFIYINNQKEEENYIMILQVELNTSESFWGYGETLRNSKTNSSS